jgi:hypothetical protein
LCWQAAIDPQLFVMAAKLVAQCGKVMTLTHPR